MGYRWGAGRRAVGAWPGRWIAGALAVALVVAGPALGMRGGAHPRDTHAVVLNGTVVGSAFALAAGIAVTNRHVVAGLGPGDPVLLIASRDGGGRAEGRVLAVSPRMDLAVLQVPPGLLPVVPAEDAPVRAGLVVEAAGIDASRGGDGAVHEASGIVIDPEERIAAFGPGLIARVPGARPGFSGSALLDAGGRLVGMVTAIRDAPAIAPVRAAGNGTSRQRPTVEAFALRAAVIRAEVRRLLAGM